MTQQEFFKRYTYSPSRDRIGGGGFGTVYKAYDNLLHREVAIKVSEVKTTADGAKTFSLRDEFEALNHVPKHPNIANYEEFYSFEMPNGVFDYAVMQYYPDGNLSNAIKQGLTAEQKEDIATQLLEGIDFLHKHKVVHRDLKPGNILIVRHAGRMIPLITDFGLSKATGMGENSVFSNSFGAGTPRYSSPEQLQGNPLRFNTDLWSYGAILYELFMGTQLFTAGSGAANTAQADMEVYNKIVNGNVQSLGKMPETWRKVAERCLVVDAGKRAKDAEELFGIITGEMIVDDDKTGTNPQKGRNAFDRTIRKLLLGKNDWTAEELQCQYDNSEELELALKNVQIRKERILVLPSGYNLLQRRKEKERIYASKNESLSIRILSYPESIALALMTSEPSDEIVTMMIVVHKDDFMDIAVIEQEFGTYVVRYTDYLSSVNVGKACLAIRRAEHEIAELVGIERIDKLLLVSDNSMDLEYKELMESVFGMNVETRNDLQLLVNQGVAIQAGVFTGCVKDVLLLSVVSQTIGVEKDDGLMMPLVYEDTTIPTRKGDKLLLDADKAWFVVDIWQGKDKVARNNANILTLRMKNRCIENGRKRNVTICVDVDSNGTCMFIMEDKDYKERMEYAL